MTNATPPIPLGSATTDALPTSIENQSEAIANRFIHRYGLWILAVLVFFLFYFQLGNYWLFDVDEPRYAEAAREMLERNGWVTPYFNYELRLEKPVFIYWLIMISYKIFGVSEFSARLVSAVSATALVSMTYWLGRHLVSRRFAFFAAVILATSIEVIGLSRMSITDMALACFMSATFISVFLVSLKSPKWWLLAGLFSGVAILTKGPVGMILPGGTLLLYSMLNNQWRRCFLTPYFPLGVAIALAIALPWYYLAYLENGQIFLDSLFHNNISRFSGAVNYHSKPVYYYLIVLIAGFLPWSPFIPAAILNSSKTLGLAGFFKKPASVSLSPLKDSLHAYAIVWATLVLIFFTAADTKLLTYILPMFPALALWLAFAFDNAFPDGFSSQSSAISPSISKTIQHWLSKTAMILFFLVAVLGFIFATQMGMLLPKEAAHISENPANWFAAGILVLGAFLFWRFIAKRKPATAFIAFASAFALLYIAAFRAIVPHVNQATQGSMMAYLKIVGQSPLATYEITRPSLTFYGRRHIAHFSLSENNQKRERAKLKAFILSYCPLNTLDKGSVSGGSCQPVYLISKSIFIKPLKVLVPPKTVLRVVDQGPVYCLIQLLHQPQPGKENL